MADTAGLLKTRGEWTDAVSAGETTLSHKDWYEQKYGRTAQSEDQSAEESKKQVKAGYDKVAAKRMTGRVA